MGTTMTRRKFHAAIAAVIGGGCCVAYVPLVKAATAGSTSKSPYRLRWRYFRRVDIVYFWIRVTKPGDPTTDISFTQQFATDSAFQNIVGNNFYVASAAKSHIVRGYYTISSGIHSKGLPLYSRILVDDDNAPLRAPLLIKAAG
jgi:hypothetical protein